MPYTVEIEDIEKAFAGFNNNIEKIRLRAFFRIFLLSLTLSVFTEKASDGRSYGYCHIDFKTVESAADTLLEEESYDLYIGGRKLVLEPSATPSISSDDLVATRNLFLTQFTETLPNPIAVATLLPKDLQARTNVSRRSTPAIFSLQVILINHSRIVSRKDGSSFGWLDFLVVEDATQAKDIITAHYEDNPEKGVLCRYKRNDRQLQQRIFSDDADPLYTGKRPKEDGQDTKDGRTWRFDGERI